MVLFHLPLLMMFKPHLLGRPFFHCIEFQHRQTKFVIYLCSQIAVFVHVRKLWFSFFPLSQNELVNFSPLHLGDLCKKMEAEWVNQCWEFPVAGVCLVRWGFKWLFYNNDCFFSFFVLPKAWATMFRLDLGVCSFWNIWGFLWLNRGHSLLSMYMNSRNLLSTFLWTF